VRALLDGIPHPTECFVVLLQRIRVLLTLTMSTGAVWLMLSLCIIIDLGDSCNCIDAMTKIRLHVPRSWDQDLQQFRAERAPDQSDPFLVIDLEEALLELVFEGGTAWGLVVGWTGTASGGGGDGLLLWEDSAGGRRGSVSCVAITNGSEPQTTITMRLSFIAFDSSHSRMGSLATAEVVTRGRALTCRSSNQFELLV
jgi:hypothetical protein